MKLETQRDRWQAVLDGHTLINHLDTGRYKMGERSLLFTISGDDWSECTPLSFDAFSYVDNTGWQLYEPKPENKVIVIGAGPSLYFVDALNPEIGYVSENDAIRAVMEWIGEKARKVEIKHPAWVERLYPCNSINGEWLLSALKAIHQALLMRWPIEVLEEV